MPAETDTDDCWPDWFSGLAVSLRATSGRRQSARLDSCAIDDSNVIRGTLLDIPDYEGGSWATKDYQEED